MSQQQSQQSSSQHQQKLKILQINKPQASGQTILSSEVKSSVNSQNSSCNFFIQYPISPTGGIPPRPDSRSTITFSPQREAKRQVHLQPQSYSKKSQYLIEEQQFDSNNYQSLNDREVSGINRKIHSYNFDEGVDELRKKYQTASIDKEPGNSRYIQTDSCIFVQQSAKPSQSLSPPAMSNHSNMTSIGPKLDSYQKREKHRHSIGSQHQQNRKNLNFKEMKLNSWLPNSKAIIAESNSSNSSLSNIANLKEQKDRKPQFYSENGSNKSASANDLNRKQLPFDQNYIESNIAKNGNIKHFLQHKGSMDEALRKSKFQSKQVLSKYTTVPNRDIGGNHRKGQNSYQTRIASFSPPTTASTSHSTAIATPHLLNKNSSSSKKRDESDRMILQILKSLKEEISKLKPSAKGSSTIPWKKVSSCFNSLKQFKKLICSQSQNSGHRHHHHHHHLENKKEAMDEFLEHFEKEMTDSVIEIKNQSQQVKQKNQQIHNELKEVYAMIQRQKEEYKTKQKQFQKKHEKQVDTLQNELKVIKKQYEKLQNFGVSRDVEQISDLRKELAQSQARQNKLIYFYYILQKRGYQVNELYIRDIKDIPTDRFRVSANINNQNLDSESFSEIPGPSISYASSSFGQSTYDQPLVVGQDIKPKKPSVVPTLDFKIVPPYESSFEDGDDFQDEDEVLYDKELQNQKVIDLGDWMERVMESRPGEVQSPLQTFEFYYKKCYRRMKSQ